MPKTATPRPLTEAEKRQRYARLTEQAKREREASMSPLARMLGFGDAERGLVRDTASAANDVAGRGVMASLIGLPGDLAGMGENGLRGLLGMPQVQPWGGSEHIGQTMQDYGLVSSERRPKTELLASLISPSAAVKTAVNAPKTAMSLLRMADNWDAPRTMARYGERGAIDVGDLGRMVAPQDEALRIAQQNAAKPVSEGGLGNMIGGDDYDVIRYDAEGDIPTFDKPHGIYTTPAGVASPHTGVGGNVSKWKLNPDAKVLNIQIDDGPSLAMRPGAKGAGGGVATVRHLLGQDTFNSIKGLKKDQLIDWIGKNTDFDPATFSNYYDSQEVMEGLGGLLARKNGYSAISYADRTPFWSSPEWDERILWAEDAVTAPQPGLLGKMVAPQDEALRVAQANAAKPVSEGGLGLRPDNTPEERAAAMGYNIPAYHGTNQPIESFDSRMLGESTRSSSAQNHHWFTDEPQVASDYAEYAAKTMPANYMEYKNKMDSLQRGINQAERRGDWDKAEQLVAEMESVEYSAKSLDYGENVIPVLLKGGRGGTDMGSKRLIDSGLGLSDIVGKKKFHTLTNLVDSPFDYRYDTPISSTHYAVSDPSRIRSRFAAFDPMRRDSSDILAGLAPIGLGGYWYGQQEP